MKKSFLDLLKMLLFALAIPANIAAQTPTSLLQMEKLTRGAVAMHKEAGGNFVSWRMLGTEPANIKFDVLRNGKVVSQNQSLTSYEDIGGTPSNCYRIVAKINDVAIDTSATINTWGNVFKRIKLQRPEGGCFVEK